MKQKVWKEYKNQLHKDLGLSLKELDNRNEWAVAEACNLIDDSNLESFYNALDRSRWESHDFLKMLEKFFIEKGYINKVNRELTTYKAIKKLEIKKDEFEKTTTMKIKRFAEIKKDN